MMERPHHGRYAAYLACAFVTSSIDTFILSFLITGSAKLAGLIATVEVVTKIVLYYLHERVWGVISWGRADKYAAAASAKVIPTSSPGLSQERVARLVDLARLTHKSPTSAFSCVPLFRIPAELTSPPLIIPEAAIAIQALDALRSPFFAIIGGHGVCTANPNTLLWPAATEGSPVAGALAN